MKNAIRIISVAMALFMCIVCFAGCGDGSKKITNSTEAISRVKTYMQGTPLSLEQSIAGALGFKKFFNPQYGVSMATQNSDGSWNVIFKGSMTGYIDEYQDDLKTYKFEVSATVSETEGVNISAHRAY